MGKSPPLLLYEFLNEGAPKPQVIIRPAQRLFCAHGGDGRMSLEPHPVRTRGPMPNTRGHPLSMHDQALR